MAIRVDYSVLDIQPTPEMKSIAAKIVELQVQYLELEKKQRHRQFREYVVTKTERVVDSYFNFRD